MVVRGVRRGSDGTRTGEPSVTRIATAAARSTGLRSSRPDDRPDDIDPPLDHQTQSALVIAKDGPNQETLELLLMRARDAAPRSGQGNPDRLAFIRCKSTDRLQVMRRRGRQANCNFIDDVQPKDGVDHPQAAKDRARDQQIRFARDRHMPDHAESPVQDGSRRGPQSSGPEGPVPTTSMNRVL